MGKWRCRVATFSNKAGFQAPLAQLLTRGPRTEEAEKSDQEKTEGQSKKQSCCLSVPSLRNPLSGVSEPQRVSVQSWPGTDVQTQCLSAHFTAQERRPHRV